MRKFVSLIGLLALSSAASATDVMQMVIGTKERVKLSLWYDGVQQSTKKDQARHISDYALPSEVLVPLRDLENKVSK